MYTEGAGTRTGSTCIVRISVNWSSTAPKSSRAPQALTSPHDAASRVNQCVNLVCSSSFKARARGTPQASRSSVEEAMGHTPTHQARCGPAQFRRGSGVRHSPVGPRPRARPRRPRPVPRQMGMPHTCHMLSHAHDVMTLEPFEDGISKFANLVTINENDRNK